VGPSSDADICPTCPMFAGVRTFASSAAQARLVDSRDNTVLPNGGGRLSDLKDVTGKSIWWVVADSGGPGKRQV